MIERIVMFIKKIFSREKTVKLWAGPAEKVALSELGGNYCSDCC